MEKYRASHGEAFSGLTKSEVKKLVYNTRNETFGSAAVSQVETQYSGPQKSAFLRHSSTFVGKDRMQRMMCFSLPHLLVLLSYEQVSVNSCVNIIPCKLCYHISLLPNILSIISQPGPDVC